MGMRGLIENYFFPVRYSIILYNTVLYYVCMYDLTLNTILGRSTGNVGSPKDLYISVCIYMYEN
jgi:hypothetical protein